MYNERYTENHIGDEKMCALSYRIRKLMKKESEDLFQKGVEYGKLEDLFYALDTDQDLTAEQKAEVDAFWGKYKLSLIHI